MLYSIGKPPRPCTDDCFMYLSSLGPANDLQIRIGAVVKEAAETIHQQNDAVRTLYGLPFQVFEK